MMRVIIKLQRVIKVAEMYVVEFRLNIHFERKYDGGGKLVRFSSHLSKQELEKVEFLLCSRSINSEQLRKQRKPFCSFTGIKNN